MKRVAVIAVHGVANQRPGETGLAIANLLANLEAPDGTPAYAMFVEETVQIPVRKLPVPNRAGLAQTTFAKRAGSLRTVDRTVDRVDVHTEFMSTLLGGYAPSGPDETYETTRRHSLRRAQAASGDAPAQPAVHVDVFEMYWADLSRLSDNALRIFVEIYQLLFHLASLGTHAIRSAQVKEQDDAPSSAWDGWGGAQRRAANALALGMLLANLFLAGLLAVLAISGLPWVSRINPVVVGVAALALVALAIGWIVVKYEAYRPGACQWAATMAAPIVVVFLESLIWQGNTGEPPLQSAVLRGGEIAYLMLTGAWIWLVINGWLAFVYGRRITKAGGANPELLMRVRWTARLTLALPAAFFSLMTTLLWSSVWSAVSHGMPSALTATHARFVLGDVLRFGALPVGEFVSRLINAAAGAGFGLMLLLALVAVVIALVAIVPAAWLEVSPPLEGAYDTWVGRWLTSGFIRMRWAGRCVFVGVMVVLPLGILVPVFTEFGLPVNLDRFWAITQWAFRGSALVLGPLAMGLFAFRDRLKGLLLHLRSVVDVTLDVDNYLREHPRTRTPRARMCARYASLLRHVLAREYDSVVIVAHSQGSVISADILRYIWMQTQSNATYLADAKLDALGTTDVRLFTMGCPLRQLYGLRFPHLYQWARHTERGPWTDVAQPILRTTGPDPATLGVSLWVNAYRSADYVGRQLWRPDDCSFLYSSASARPTHPWAVGTNTATASHAETPPASNRREFCIGKGAHTHYWDATAPQIALELDTLIT